MRNQQSGFTLIELIIVIVILGILAAFALPRFADLGGDAREASIQGAAGSMKSASAIVRSAFLAGGAPVVLEGVTIPLVGGYPSEAGIMLAAQISADDYTITGGVVSLSGAPGTCEVEYEEAVAPAAPTITVDVSGC